MTKRIIIHATNTPADQPEYAPTCNEPYFDVQAWLNEKRISGNSSDN